MPARHGVAAFAVSAKLAAVDVGVTIGAVGADIFENQAGMAGRASHLLVHSAQGVGRLVVIELRVRPDRSPTGVGMAIGAGC